MTSESQQEDMSMEDILSSIKDILENDAQDQTQENTQKENAPVEKVSSEPQANIPVVAEDDEVFDLSKSMIIDDSEEPKSAEQNIAQAETISTSDFDADFSAAQAEAEEEGKDDEDILSLNIDDILQSANQTIDADQQNAPREENQQDHNQDVDFQFDNTSLPEIDVDSDPIFDEADFSKIDLSEDTDFNLDNHISSADESNTPVAQEVVPAMAEEIAPAPVEEIAAPMPKNELQTDSQVLEEITPEVEEVAEPVVEEVSEPIVKEAAPQMQMPRAEKMPEPEEKAKQSDAADVSAGIISNFAKMFAEQSQERQEKETKTQSEIPVAVSGMGDGNKTIEQVVEGVIQNIVAASVNAEMTKNVDIVAYAKKEIHAQTRAWLEANLPAIVEAAVQKEMERVMVKVGH